MQLVPYYISGCHLLFRNLRPRYELLGPPWHQGQESYIQMKRLPSTDDIQDASVDGKNFSIYIGVLR